MVTKKHLSASIDAALLDELEKLHANKSSGVEAAIRAYLKEQKKEYICKLSKGAINV